MIDIFIARTVIEDNKKNGTNNPPIVVHKDGESKYAHDVMVKGPCWVTHRPNSPHASGVTVWLVTDGEVEIIR